MNLIMPAISQPLVKLLLLIKIHEKLPDIKSSVLVINDVNVDSNCTSHVCIFWTCGRGSYAQCVPRVTCRMHVKWCTLFISVCINNDTYTHTCSVVHMMNTYLYSTHKNAAFFHICM